MEIRYGFVSNSSSSSFILPRKHLSNEDDKIISNACCNGTDYFHDELYSSSNYFYGRVSHHNINLLDVIKKYKNFEGVDYED